MSARELGFLASHIVWRGFKLKPSATLKYIGENGFPLDSKQKNNVKIFKISRLLLKKISVPFNVEIIHQIYVVAENLKKMHKIVNFSGFHITQPTLI